MGEFLEPDLSSLVLSLYEASQTPTMMNSALDKIRSTFGFEAYHQFVLDAKTGAPKQEWSNNHITADDMAAYSEHYFKVDPRPTFAAQLGVGQLFCTDDFISPHERAHSELYQDFLMPVAWRIALAHNWWPPTTPWPLWRFWIAPIFSRPVAQGASIWAD
jgi:hypothetical protein